MSTSVPAPAITTWFNARNVTVRSVSVPDDRATLLSQFARSTDESEPCAKLIRTLAYVMRQKSGNPKPIYISGKRLSDQDIAGLRRFANYLCQLGLASKAFRPKGAAVGVVPLTRCRANGTNYDEITQLLSGGWYEYFALGVALEELDDSAIVVHNVDLSLPGGQRLELDVFALQGDEPVWIECKSGAGFQQHLARYGTFAKDLGISRERSILCSRRLDESAAAAGLLHGISVATSGELAAAVQTAAAAISAAPATTSARRLSRSARKAAAPMNAPPAHRRSRTSHLSRVS